MHSMANLMPKHVRLILKQDSVPNHVRLIRELDLVPNHVRLILERGNASLWRHGSAQMDSEIIEKVKEIYEKCKASCFDAVGDTPLITASRLGLEHMVWGFINCAKQTNTNLHNGNRGKFEEFLGYTNFNFNSALHEAAASNHDVVVMLLVNASPELLISARNRRGKTPLSLLPDKTKFAALEVASKAEADTLAATIISIDDEERESMVYTERIMDRTSYKLLDKEMSLNKLAHGDLELTPNRNTILHIASKFGDVKYVKDIIQQHPSLIRCRNSEGETPAYVAAREGHSKIVEMFVVYLKTKHNDIEKFMTRSIDNENALHTVIRYHHAAVVFLLTKEVPGLANHINKFEESPLYVAAEIGYDAIIQLVLEKCKERALGGPNGKTALHAAAISGSVGCIKHLLLSKTDLLYARDDNGWTALHTGASRGHCMAIKVLLDECPGCQEILDSKGRNILHVAVENEKKDVIAFIFQDTSLASLINQKDSNGNTPIHMLAASNFEMTIIRDHRIDVTALNNEKQTPLDMAASDEKRKTLLQAIIACDSEDSQISPRDPSSVQEKTDSLKSHLESMFNMANNLVLVATLIATATFAAGFAVPGGFNGNEGSKQGMPIFLRKSAFQAFVITNALAFSCACSVLIGYIRLLAIHLDSEPNEEVARLLSIRVAVMYMLNGTAMVTMATAFITGTYVVLIHSLGFAVSICVMCLFIMVFTLVFPATFVYFVGKCLELIKSSLEILL